MSVSRTPLRFLPAQNLTLCVCTPSFSLLRGLSGLSILLTAVRYPGLLWKPNAGLTSKSEHFRRYNNKVGQIRPSITTKLMFNYNYSAILFHIDLVHTTHSLWTFCQKNCRLLHGKFTVSRNILQFSQIKMTSCQSGS